MALGPVELIVLKFPEPRFSGEIAAALEELVQNETIRIIDIMFVHKNDDGSIKMLEINDLDDDDYATFDPIVADITGLLSADDLEYLSATLERGASAALMLFEDTWATRFRDAVVNARGELVLSERIPAAAIDELMAAHAVA